MSLITSPPHLTRFVRSIRDHNPNGISIGLAVFAQMTAEYPYTLQWGVPFSPQNCPFPWRDLDMVLWAHVSQRVWLKSRYKLQSLALTEYLHYSSSKLHRPTPVARRVFGKTIVSIHIEYLFSFSDWKWNQICRLFEPNIFNPIFQSGKWETK